MKIFCLALLCLILTSCESAADKSSIDNAARLRLREAADKGDKEAQYELGNAYCCGRPGGFWDTTEAVKWWCKAAKQGQPEAAAAIVNIHATCEKAK